MREALAQPKPHTTSHTLASRVAIFKHPIHPMLVVYPVAFLSMLPVTDLLFLWLHQSFWALASYWLSVGGLGLGVLAALMGVLDMFSLRVVRRHISAWNHFIAGVMVLALAATGVWLRAPDPVAAVYPWGLLLSGVTLLAVMVAGWLGGTLTFRHGIGVYGDEPETGEDSDDRGPPAE